VICYVDMIIAVPYYNGQDAMAKLSQKNRATFPNATWKYENVFTSPSNSRKRTINRQKFIWK